MDPCERWEEQISALLDGELSDGERLELMEHLSGCDACRRYLEDLTAIGEALEAVPAPEGLAQSVLERVRHTRQDGRPKIIRWQRWGLLAACCALVILGVWRFYPQGGQDAAHPAVGARSAMERTADAPAAQSETAECGIEPEDPPDGDAAEAYSMDTKTSPAYSAPAELLDCETASELFGHPLVPCTADNFEGYYLDWVSDGRGGEVIYVHAVYQFSNGTASVWDNDRAGGCFPLADDYESVVYKGETFYVRDAEHGGGRPVVEYRPNGETGLSYSARFDAEVAQDEVFDLLLSLRIP